MSSRRRALIRLATRPVLVGGAVIGVVTAGYAVHAAMQPHYGVWRCGCVQVIDPGQGLQLPPVGSGTVYAPIYPTLAPMPSTIARPCVVVNGSAGC
jgi:hypothetical protein